VKEVHLASMESEVDEVTTQMTVGPPKHQATVPVEARKVLGINQLDEGEKAIVEATLKVQKIETSD
jgi:bifunctional DNA-binding transcriptional regulator/antitoxin component of YhaV-PrlF toxin-antitoxin module